MNKATKYAARLNLVTNYVAENLDKAHSIEHLAELAHFSKFHFHRIYKALTGETVQGMVSRLRLEGAASSLVYEKTKPVTQVAVEHGYSSGANFTKAFTKQFGCSPTQYRRSSKIGKALAAKLGESSGIELEVRLRPQPETQLAYIRRQGKYLHLEISAMHSEVQQWVEERGCATSEPLSIGITWSDSQITEEANWMYDACVAVQTGTQSDGEVGVQTLQGGLVAQIEVELAEGDSHDLSPYWDWLIRDWFLDSDYELRASPSYEVYEAGHVFRVRLCLPIESTARRK